VARDGVSTAERQVWVAPGRAPDYRSAGPRGVRLDLLTHNARRYRIMAP
jgi:hypothetical protein